MENKELREKIASIIKDGLISNLDMVDQILALINPASEPTAGQELYMDLCGRLIRRILEFNPDEHDIELNLCGIIEKAKLLGNNTCMCMDCGESFKVSEQSKHFKECKKDHSLKPQTFTEDDFLKRR
jgi:hypothetical protein